MHDNGPRVRPSLAARGAAIHRRPARDRPARGGASRSCAVLLQRRWTPRARSPSRRARAAFARALGVALSYLVPVFPARLAPLARARQRRLAEPTRSASERAEVLFADG